MNTATNRVLEPESTPEDTSAYWNPSRKTITQDELLAFADRLFKRMSELGLTQSDLARKAFGCKVVDGAEQVKDRDKVSLYLRGKGLPGEQKMRQLAAALDMKLEDLAPPPPRAPRQVRESSSDMPPSARQEGYHVRAIGKGHAQVFISMRLRSEDAAELMAKVVEYAKHV